jgi:hypothetical protein
MNPVAARDKKPFVNLVAKVLSFAKRLGLVANCEATGDIELRIAIWEHHYPRTRSRRAAIRNIGKPWEAGHEKTRALHRARDGKKT